MSEQAKHSIYFKSLLLENIRSFGEQQAIVLTTKDDRPAPWTLLVGDNGVGKTTILQCLARMRRYSTLLRTRTRNLVRSRSNRNWPANRTMIFSGHWRDPMAMRKRI